MPLPGRLTVDQAVDEMLKAPGRIDVAAAPEPKALESKAPTEEEPPTATSAPVAGEVEPAVAAGSSRPFVIEVPEFTVARPPAPEQVRLEPESATPAETAAAPEITAAPIAEAATSERPARLGEMRAAPMHPEPPPPRAASEPPPPADAVAAPPTPPAEIAAVPPPPRHPALAAIAALSDDEKIALFS